VAIQVEDPPRPYQIGIVYKSRRRLSRVAQMLCAVIASYVRIDRTRIHAELPTLLPGLGRSTHTGKT